MTPLEATKRLIEGGFVECFCAGHDPECPVPSVPRIVAALEAAEALLWATDAADSLPRSVVIALDDLEIALGEGQTSEVPA